MSEEITIRLNKDHLWKYSTFVLLAVVVIGAIVLFTGDSSRSEVTTVGNNPTQQVAGTTERVEVSIDDDPVLGEKDAPVTIIEFSDYQCPFCRKFWQDTFPSLKREYIETGKVRFVYRDFPLNFHPSAIPAAEAANCAREKGGDAAYFKMHDKIFEEQNILDGGSVSSTVQFSTEDLKRWAKDIGYNIDSCLNGGKYVSEIQKDLQEGSAVGVQGTPGFFINGQPLSGAQPYSVFKQMIDAELSG